VFKITLITAYPKSAGSFFLEPEDIKNLGLGPYGTSAKEQGSPELISDYGAQRALYLRPRCIGTIRARIQKLINQSFKTLRVQSQLIHICK
jgi:hypothetical protein